MWIVQQLKNTCQQIKNTHIKIKALGLVVFLLSFFSSQMPITSNPIKI